MSQAPRPKFNPQKHHRRSIRLKGYDYSSESAYYITIVTQERKCILGEIVDGEIHLNEYGEIVQKRGKEIPTRFLSVGVGTFIIMPNPIHGINFITAERRGAVLSPHNGSNNNIQNAYGVEPRTWAGQPRPYANGHWDKLLHISNINLPKR